MNYVSCCTIWAWNLATKQLCVTGDVSIHVSNTVGGFSQFGEVQVHLLFVTATQNIFNLKGPLVAGVQVAAFRRVRDRAGLHLPLHLPLQQPSHRLFPVEVKAGRKRSQKILSGDGKRAIRRHYALQIFKQNNPHLFRRFRRCSATRPSKVGLALKRA